MNFRSSFLVGENENEYQLLENYFLISKCFNSVPEKFQTVIADITMRMGKGMAEFAETDVIVDTIEDWDRYCHYVAGLVGYGLSSIFANCGVEDAKYFSQCHQQANSMGLFLQKTNIIRDYLEDLEEDRVWWPKVIWGKYAKAIDEFADPKNIQNSLNCINNLITNALSHIPDCLEYLSHVKDPNNFKFCAIPQVMALATLIKCYNNPDVFKGNVKIRRGTAAKIFLYTQDMQSVYQWYFDLSHDLLDRIPKNDPSRQLTLAYLQKVLEIVAPHVSPVPSFGVSDGIALAGLALSAGYLFNRHRHRIVRHPKL